MLAFYLPELLGCVLAADALQDLGSAWVLVDKAAHLVDAIVDDDVQPLLHRVVLRHLLLADCLGHGGGS